jgi:hypothetical protein
MPLKPMPGGEASTPQVTIPADILKKLREAGYTGPATIDAGRLGTIADKYLNTDNTNDNTNPDNPVYPPPVIVMPGGGGGGGGGGMTAAQKKSLRDSYLQVLWNWDWGEIEKNIMNMVDKGVANKWSVTSFIMEVRKTQEWKERFPYLKARSNHAEAEFLRYYEQYREIAENNGRHLSRQEFGHLWIKMDVTPQEWQVRMQFYNRATGTAGKSFFSEIETVAKRMGIIKPSDKLSEKDLYKIMTHRGDQRIERLLDEANVRQRIENIGFTIGAHGDLGRKEVLNVIKQIESGGGDAKAESGKAFANLAQMAKTALPAAELVKAGLSKRDLWDLEFGKDEARKSFLGHHVQSILEAYQHTVTGDKKIKESVQQTETGTSLGLGTIQRPEGL